MGAVSVMIVALLSALIFGLHVRAEQARNHAMTQSRAAFTAVKEAYLSDEFSRSYRVLSDAPKEMSPTREGGAIYAQRDYAELIPAIEQTLQALEAIDPDHLPPCDARLSLIIPPELTERLEIFVSRVARGSDRLEPNDGKPMAAMTIGDLLAMASKRTSDPLYDPLSDVTKALTGSPLSPRQLLTIAHVEKARVEEAMSHLEARLIEQGAAENLDAFAANSDLRTQDPAAILAQYETALARARQSFYSQFYTYDIDDASVMIENGRHPMRARGSYHPGENMVRIYKEGPPFELKMLGFVAVHENWPGHHLQSEMKSQPGLCPDESARLFSGEAWATYTEYLANEAGVFDDPVWRLGWLDYRLMRVGRIVMDMRDLQDNLSKDDLRLIWTDLMPDRLHQEFEQEYARIFGAQKGNDKRHHHHLNYLLGYQSIQAAKDRQSAVLGDDFDVRKFHHLLLTGAHGDVAQLNDMLDFGMMADADTLNLLER